MYVKFISKKNEWFDPYTEVFDGSINDYNKPIKRVSITDFKNNWEQSGIILGFGKRNRHWDMEVCPLDEFDIEYTEEQI